MGRSVQGFFPSEEFLIFAENPKVPKSFGIIFLSIKNFNLCSYDEKKRRFFYQN